MMVRAGVAGGLMVLCCVSCGGATHASDTDVMMTPMAGATATGGTTGQGGGDTLQSGGNSMQSGGDGMQSGGDTATEPLCLGSGPPCLSDCASFMSVTDAICVAAKWVCPAGTRPFDDCPANACVRRTQSCCAPNGSVTLPDCADDGAIGECPSGFATTTEKCLPQGVPIEDCAELEQGQACTDPELVCYTSKCGRNCTCTRDEAGNLSWSCSALPC